MQNFRLCEKNILKSKRRSFQSNKKSNNLFKSFKKKNMVCQKKAIFEKNHKPTPLQKCKFFGQAVTRAYEGNREGYKGLKEVTRRYKRLQGVRGSWKGTRNMETNLPKKNLIKPSTLSI